MMRLTYCSLAIEKNQKQLSWESVVGGAVERQDQFAAVGTHG
jgi:hypothetical protein